MLKSHPGATIIADVKASQVLFDEIARAGGKPLMCKTGHSLIKSKMAEIGAPLAGEMSGHIFFADTFYGFDDALYCGLRLLNIVANAGESLAEMRDGLPQPVNTPELRFDCPDERKFEVVEEVKARLQKAGAKFTDIDGVRVSTEDGWWLLRASNTQAVLVARCEAADEAGLERLKARTQGGAGGKRRQPAGRGVGRASLMRFFFYGTLLDHDVTALVLGRRLPPAAFVPASLLGPRAAAGQGRAAIRSSCVIRAARCRASSSAV